MSPSTMPCGRLGVAAVKVTVEVAVVNVTASETLLVTLNETVSPVEYPWFADVMNWVGERAIVPVLSAVIATAAPPGEVAT